MSKRRINNKGMTLVEIVIVLLIASIAMTITGGILINSLGYFQDTTELSTDKTAGDGVLDFIKNEIQYSTKVSVQKDIPSNDDWHCLYVQNDQLYKDSDPVFTKTNTKKGDYYGNRKLEIKTNCFNNGYRMDMEIYLNTGSGTNKETKYKVTHTFEFLNLKKDKNSGSTTTTVWNTDKGTLSTDYKLWYIKDASAITPDTDDGKKDDTDTDSTGDGTVADIINNIDPSNYAGVFESNNNIQYNKYEIVWYDGYWWQNIYDNNNGKMPGDTSGQVWKKLDKYFDINSTYEYGDIVIYNDKYYKMTSHYYYTTGRTPDYTLYKQWDCLGDINDKDVVAQVKLNRYDKKLSYTVETVVNQYISNPNVLKDANKSNYDEYVQKPTTGSDYQKGDIVKVANDLDGSFYDLWIKQKGIGNYKAPGTPDSGWIKIDRYWSSKSSYVIGNMIYSSKQNGIAYVKVVRDIDSEIELNWTNTHDRSVWIDGKEVRIKKYYQPYNYDGSIKNS